MVRLAGDPGTRRRADPERNWDFLKGFVLQGNERGGINDQSFWCGIRRQKPHKKASAGGRPRTLPLAPFHRALEQDSGTRPQEWALRQQPSHPARVLTMKEEPQRGNLAWWCKAGMCSGQGGGLALSVGNRPPGGRTLSEDACSRVKTVATGPSSLHKCFLRTCPWPGFESLWRAGLNTEALEPVATTTS